MVLRRVAALQAVTLAVLAVAATLLAGTGRTAAGMPRPTAPPSRQPAPGSEPAVARDGRMQPRQQRGRWRKQRPSLSPENRKVLKEIAALDYNLEEEGRELVSTLVGGVQLNHTCEFVPFINELGKRHCWPEALALLHDQKHRRKLSIEVCNAALVALSKAGQWESIVQLLSDMWDRQPAPRADSYNIAMAACEVAQEWRQALALLADMKRAQRRKCDFLSYNVSIHACVQGQQWACTLKLMDEMIRNGITPNWKLYTLAIIMAGEGGRWSNAVELLASMWEREVVPDIVTYSSVISICGNCGHWEEALHLLGEMRRKGFPPDFATHSALTRACRECGQTGLAEALEHDMQILSGGRTPARRSPHAPALEVT